MILRMNEHVKLKKLKDYSSRRRFNKAEDGIVIGENLYMVDGWIDEVREKSQESNHILFEDQVGYVDETGSYVLIYYDDSLHEESLDEDPDTPFFMAYQTDNGTVKIKTKFLPREVMSKYSVDRIRSISLSEIAKMTEGLTELYDEDTLSEIRNSSSKFNPIIYDDDDFLKKIIKTVILRKGINPYNFRPLFEKAHTITNMIQALQNSTKINPITFGEWMRLCGCKFVMVVKGTGEGEDLRTPLNATIGYNSDTGKVILKEEGDEINEDKVYAKSANQFADRRD